MVCLLLLPARSRLCERNLTTVHLEIADGPSGTSLTGSDSRPHLYFRANLAGYHIGPASHDEVDRHFASRQDLASKPYPDSAAALAGHLFHFFINNFGRPAVSIGDAGCVGSVIDPDGLTKEVFTVYVETGGRYCRGMTVVDRRPKDMIERHAPGENDPYSEVILDINEEFYREMFRETVCLPDSDR